MRIGKKLLLSFLFITLMVGVVGYFSISISKKTLQKTLGKEALHLAISSMREIDEEVYDRIEELSAFANDLSLAEYCIASNSKFDKITGVKNLIDTVDKDWQGGKDAPFIQSILSNKLSKRLANYHEFYMQKYGYAVFSEIYVTNKYGVVIGATNRTSDYLQADEDWYKKAIAEKAFWVGDVEYDASSNAITFDIVINLYDKNGNFVGILKAPLNTEDVRKSVEHIYSESEYKSVSPHLVDKNGRVIFNKLNPELKQLGRDVKLEEYGENISFREPVAEVLKGNNGFLSNRTGNKELLTVFSHSNPLRDFKGLGWSLIIDYEAEEVFRSIVRLRNILIIVFVTLIAIASLAGRFIARSISRPLIQLKDASIDFGKGNLSARVDIHSKDEIGQLSAAFNKMAADLKEKDDRLQAYSQELDAKVRERTQELRNSNEQLCESVNKYRTLVEQIPAIVYIASLDERGSTLYISPQIKSLTGFSPEEWLADPALWSKQIHPDDRKRVLAEYKSSFGKGQPFRSEYRWFTRDGKTLWCYDDAAIVKDGNGKPLFYQGVVFDITEHKLANEEMYLMQTLTLAISASANLRDALLITLQKICNLSGWVYGEAWLPNPDGTFLERNHNFYSSLDNCKIFTGRSGEITFPPGEGLPGRAWSTKQPVWVEDVTLDQNYLRAPIANEAGLKTGVAFPVITDNDVIAIIVFYHRTVEKRNERLVKLILTVLSHIGSIIRRKQSEDSLRRNEARLANAQQIAHLGNWEWDIRKNKVWWSDETYRIFDLTPSAFGSTQEAFLNAVHPDDREFVTESVDKALNGQTPYNNEYRIVRPDGSVRIAHSQGEVVYDGTGGPIQMKGTVQDITERKQTEEALKEQYFLGTLGANIGFALIQPGTLRDILQNCAESLVRNLNVAFARIWTLNRKENVLELQSSAGLYTHIDGSHSRVPVGKLKIGLIAQERKPLLTNSVIGDSRVNDQEWAKRMGMTAFAGYPLIIEGRLVGVMAMFAQKPLTEITLKALGSVSNSIALGIEHKRMEDQLQKLSSAVEQSSTTIVITDTKGNIQYVNPKFTQLTGYTSEEAIGQNPCILKSGKTPPEVYKQLWDAITAGGEWQGEFCNRKKNGEFYWELAHISSLRNSEGAITGFIAFKDDITERKRIEAEREKLREQLFRSQNLASVGKLAGGVAHNFNNLLTVIMGYASILKTEMKKDDTFGEYVQKILKSSETAAHLVQGLLAFSRKQPANPQPVNLNGIIRETEYLLLKLIREDIRLKTALTEKECMVMADVGQLEQVLMNLATNARDAMPEGGNLSISTEVFDMDDAFISAHGYGEKGRYALMSFSDTGVGMDENTKMRIFEPFFTTKEVGKGTGLGLASVYGIVKQYRGYIDVDSAPDKGATFRIYLPLIESEVSGEKAEIVPVPKGGTETILIAEDEEDVRSLMKMVLETNGYKVIEAEDGEHAINTFLQDKDNITLLVFDVVMPKKNGKEAYEAIKKIKPGMKVLFMSGYGDDVISTSDIHKSGFNYITKPVSPMDLLKKVREVLDK